MYELNSYDSQEVIDIILSSKSYKEALRKLGWNDNNTRLNKKIEQFCSENSITTDHFSRKVIKNGTKFGNWTIIDLSEKTDSSRNKYYLCECSCSDHTRRIISANSLRRGLSLSCGCFAKERAKEYNFIDLTNKTFCNLFVLSLDEESYLRKGRNFWNCKCKICNNICQVSTTDLRSGERTDCGGHKKERISEKLTQNLSNKIFGKLTVLKRDDEKWNNKQSPWICQCECGRITSVAAGHLNAGHTQSCGLCKISKGENKIKQVFEENNINFVQQYVIKDLKRLRFDFAILNDNKQLIGLIEYQGRQHYEAIEYFGGEENFKRQKENDKKKQEYCKKYNIPLLLIPYWDFNKISIEYLKDFKDCTSGQIADCDFSQLVDKA